MAQEITVSLDKLNQLYLDTARALNAVQPILKARLQEIVGSDRFNEDDNEFIEKNESLRSGPRAHSTILIDGKLDWTHISSALMHELDEGASYHVMKAVKKLDISTIILSEALQKKLNKKMLKQEIHYIRKLIDRAIQNTKEAPPPATTSLNQRHCAPREEDAGTLNADTLIDIYDTHRIYKFTTFQFETYSKHEFMETIETNKFLKQKKDQIANIFDESYANRKEFVLYPSWLIADDQFIIFNYFFGTSYIVNELRVNPTRNEMKFSIYIIPKKIVSIYDENISFAATLPSNIGMFLEQNGFKTFCRAAIDESVCDDPQTLYQIIMHYLSCPHPAYLSQDLLLIIDRRDA
eukprot:685707_1